MILELLYDNFSTVVLVAVATVLYLYYTKPKPQPYVQPPRIPLQNRVVQKKKAETSTASEGEGPRLTILFGSQTGTAEDFSHKLSSEAKRYKFVPKVVDMETYDSESLASERLVVLVAATYGEGEPTDNAKEFYEWLMDESREENCLQGVKYTVFGLGNKTYEHYNVIGKKLDKRMEELGATRIFRHGEGDDDDSLEDDFAAWKKELWPDVAQQFGLSVDNVGKEDLTERRFKIDFYGASSPQAGTAAKHANTHLMAKRGSGSSSTYDIKNPYLGRLVVNRELHQPTSDRSCRHIEFQIDNHLKFEVGDHLGVFAQNSDDVVTEAATRLGVDLNATFSLFNLQNNSSRPLLGPVSVRQALKEWCDLTNPPRKAVLAVFAHYAQNPEEKQKLQELSDDSKHQPYGHYIKDAHRTVLDVLNEFPSVKIPFDHFIEIIPRLAPRYYSISSSLKAHPGRVHITCVVVSFTNGAGRVHHGVCSNWLAQRIPEADNNNNNNNAIVVPIFIHKAQFHLPKNKETPIVMVGPGTGLAPFRGFIQERAIVKQQTGSVGDNLLFFGCRSSTVDFIYGDELLQAQKEGFINLFLAFSREKAEKVYVQHRMREVVDLIWKALHEQNGYFYVCGDARVMARDVHEALEFVAETAGHMTRDQAIEFANNLQKSGRYLSDTWF